jgi:beta-glucosidase-like glycosyl hydrolase
LTAEYARQYVRGMQQGIDTRYYKVISTCKHFLAYDIEDGSGAGVHTDRHHFNAVISDLDLAETQLPAFESCIRDGQAAGVMCSYNEVNGIPTCSHPLYETTLLRDEWGFQGNMLLHTRMLHVKDTLY